MSNKDVTRTSIKKYVCADVTEIIIQYLKGRTFWESLKLGYVEIVIRKLETDPHEICAIEVAAKMSNQQAIMDIIPEYKTKNPCKKCLSYNIRG